MGPEPKYVKSKTSIGWPEPADLPDVRKLSNLELADYLAACGPEYDGVPDHVREALVRLLLYDRAFQPPQR